jgi:hypothetical protein
LKEYEGSEEGRYKGRNMTKYEGRKKQRKGRDASYI